MGLLLGCVLLLGTCVLFSMLFWLARKAVRRLRLRGRGVRVEGECLGHVIGRDTAGIVVTYPGPDGERLRATLDGWEGMLPPAGGPVPLVYLPESPRIAAKWPVEYARLRAAGTAVLVLCVGLGGLELLVKGVRFIVHGVG
ncbi:hypothetical protein [Streptomyces sp. bgisy060]|uniref:hypothetical protein n=1 Tax=Streptomyces sp. bgisy060 TaxID=3413775 RepID=UPI003EB7E1EF